MCLDLTAAAAGGLVLVMLEVVDDGLWPVYGSRTWSSTFSAFQMSAGSPPIGWKDGLLLPARRCRLPTCSSTR